MLEEVGVSVYEVRDSGVIQARVPIARPIAPWPPSLRQSAAGQHGERGCQEERDVHLAGSTR